MANKINRKKSVTIQVDRDELRFEVGLTEFNQFQNEFLPQNKTAPAENFLMACAHPEDKDQILNWCDQGLSVDFAQILAEEFKPQVSISVKRSTAP